MLMGILFSLWSSLYGDSLQPWLNLFLGNFFFFEVIGDRPFFFSWFLSWHVNYWSVKSCWVLYVYFVSWYIVESVHQIEVFWWSL